MVNPRGFFFVHALRENRRGRLNILPSPLRAHALAREVSLTAQQFFNGMEYIITTDYNII